MEIRAQRHLHKKNMRILLSILAVALLLISCQNEHKEKLEEPVVIAIDSTYNVIDTIVAIAAQDFFKSQQPLPKQFRDVTLKKRVKPNGEVLFLLCGEFRTADSEWIHFTTIKNSDYEQWIGESGISYCTEAETLPCQKDLAEALTQRIRQKISE
ncbi:MAG: hypothetical protein U0T73_07880 [Chitinophagales bacterium]